MKKIPQYRHAPESSPGRRPFSHPQCEQSDGSPSSQDYDHFGLSWVAVLKPTNFTPKRKSRRSVIRKPGNTVFRYRRNSPPPQEPGLNMTNDRQEPSLNHSSASLSTLTQENLCYPSIGLCLTGNFDVEPVPCDASTNVISTTSCDQDGSQADNDVCQSGDDANDLRLGSTVLSKYQSGNLGGRFDTRDVPRHLDMLPDLSRQCKLLEHWVVRVCDSMNPVPGIHNPLRTVFMPIALEGARNSAKKSTAATALFHMICSVSALHLSKTKNYPLSKESLEILALQHSHLAITHLAQNIQPTNKSQHLPILATLIMCIYSEEVAIPSPIWRTHFQGAVEWVNQIDPYLWHADRSSSAVYQMFLGLATLVRTQLLFEDDRKAVWDVSNDAIVQSENYILGTSYGLPRTILQAIHCMNILRTESAAIMTFGLDSAVYWHKLDKLEAELFLSVPAESSNTNEPEHKSLLYHYGSLFYYGALIYLKRMLRGSALREVQPLVEKALHHMEALVLSPCDYFCPLLWPITIIAFEANDPNICRRILKCIGIFCDRTGLLIWAQLASIAQMLWALREVEGNGDMKWDEGFLSFSNDKFIFV